MQHLVHKENSSVCFALFFITIMSQNGIQQIIHEIEHEHKKWSTRRWSVAIACSCINFFIFSVFRSASVIYVALKDELNCSNAEASWPVTLASGVAALSCLGSGFLSHYFEKQRIVFTGIVVTSFAIAICYFANGLAFVIVFLGVVQGVGIGLVTVLLPAIIGEHFGDQRTAAVGLSYAGATIGAFIFPMFFSWLLRMFALRTSLLLMGVINLSALPAVMLLKSPSGGNRNNSDSVHVQRKKGEYEPVPNDITADHVINDCEQRNYSITTSRQSSAAFADDRNDDNDNRERTSIGEVVDVNEMAISVANETLDEMRTQESIQPKEKVINKEEKVKRIDESVSLAMCEDENVAQSLLKSDMNGILCDSGVIQETTTYIEAQSSKFCDIENKIDANGSPTLVTSIANENSTVGGLTLLNGVKHGATIPMIKPTLEETRSSICLPAIRLNENSKELSPTSTNETRSRWWRTLVDHMKADALFLCDPYFALISFTYICFIVCNVTLLIILLDYARDCGVDEKRAILLVSMYSVTDLCGRLLPGWLSYAQIASNKALYIASITVLGSLFLAFPMLLSNEPPPDTAFYILLGLTLTCGFVAGCLMILSPVVIGDYLGAINVPIAFGLSNFICGLVSFTRPFLIGYIKDRTNQYDDIFYLLGSFALMSALCWYVEMFVCNIRFKSKRNDITTSRLAVASRALSSTARLGKCNQLSTSTGVCKRGKSQIKEEMT